MKSYSLRKMIEYCDKNQFYFQPSNSEIYVGTKQKMTKEGIYLAPLGWSTSSTSMVMCIDNVEQDYIEISADCTACWLYDNYSGFSPTVLSGDILDEVIITFYDSHFEIQYPESKIQYRTYEDYSEDLAYYFLDPVNYQFENTQYVARWKGYSLVFPALENKLNEKGQWYLYLDRSNHLDTIQLKTGIGMEQLPTQSEFREYEFLAQTQIIDEMAMQQSNRIDEKQVEEWEKHGT